MVQLQISDLIFLVRYNMQRTIIYRCLFLSSIFSFIYKDLNGSYSNQQVVGWYNGALDFSKVCSNYNLKYSS